MADAAAAPPAGPSVLEIDAAALAANYRTLAALAGGAETAAVVKADGYGLGIASVAPALAGAGCRSFFVASLGEGVALRRLLPDAAIYVLNGCLAGEAERLRAARLAPVLNAPAQIALWEQDGAGAPAALHLDTGMNRLGLGSSELAALLADAIRLKRLGLDLVLSHLACSDEPNHALNRRQRDTFAASVARLRAIHGPVRASLANSGGILLGPDYMFDMVRAGIALYGADPLGEGDARLRPVARLLGRILQVRDVDPDATGGYGATVGYGATHRIARRARLATVAVGYADGYLRSLSPRATGFIGNIEVPLVGRVSMDLTVFDVTAAGQAAQPGVLIELIGPHLPVEQVARTAGTIPYEILTRLGPRLGRSVIGAA